MIKIFNHNYIENIHRYIIEEKYTLLIHVIIDKCIEINGIISDNSYLPNNLKLLVLSKINSVYSIFAPAAALIT